MKNKLIIIFILFLSYSSFSQTPEDAKKKYPIRKVINKNNIALSTSINTDFNYNFCDDDGDGTMTIDLTTILDEVQVTVGGDLISDNPKFIARRHSKKIG